MSDELKNQDLGSDAPAHGEHLNPSHAADIMVAADRTFRAVVRSGRTAGMSTAAAIQRANQVAYAKTGIDMLEELQLDPGAFDENRTSSTAGDGGLDSVQRFLQEWQHGEIENAPFMPCLGSHLYAAYRKWCDTSGERAPRSLAQFVGTIKNLPRWRAGQPTTTFKTLADKTPFSRKMVIPPDELLESSSESATRGDKTQAEWLTVCFFKFSEAQQCGSGQADTTQPAAERKINVTFRGGSHLTSDEAIKQLGSILDKGSKNDGC